MATDETVSTAEAAEILGVSPITVARYVRQGRLEPVDRLPYGRGVYVLSRAEVERLAVAANPRKVAAGALRAAADALEHPIDQDVVSWLRERADAIERNL